MQLPPDDGVWEPCNSLCREVDVQLKVLSQKCLHITRMTHLHNTLHQWIGEDVVRKLLQIIIITVIQWAIIDVHVYTSHCGWGLVCTHPETLNDDRQ